MRNYHLVWSIISIGLIFSFIQEAQGDYGMANFQIQGDEWASSDNDSISSGIHLAQGFYGISVFNQGGSVLGNITYTLDADNIVWMADEEYAKRNGSFIHWVYPTDRVIVPGDWIYTTVNSGYYYSKYVPMNINRWTNKSIFNSDGYQLAQFNVTFENSNCDFIYGAIRINEHTLANATFSATILNDTFRTDAPIENFSENNTHAIAFDLDRTLNHTNKTYNFSVVIKLNSTINDSSTISAIEYKPYFSMSLVNERHDAGETGFTVTMPVDMLTDHVNYASASTNISTTWTYSNNFMRGMVLNEFFNVINSTGSDTVGIYRNGSFYLRNANSAGSADMSFIYGMDGDIPLVGDWNGDGIDTVGIYRHGAFYLRNNNSAGSADLSFIYGMDGDIPLIGDWNGDGVDTVGIYRHGAFYLRNSNSAGSADLSFVYGMDGDIPLVGDWNGDDTDTVGIYRHGSYYLRNSNTAGNADLSFIYGVDGDTPLVGDWTGSGTDTVGIYRAGAFYLRNSNSAGNADLSFIYGIDSDTPLVGDWNGS
ncbi:MAG: hypothetical protein O8C61_11490 [Candidatus Methanoperedens sp.]|nr:hypothetical protein [Candidatus Methanoperedens sp.]